MSGGTSRKLLIPTRQRIVYKFAFDIKAGVSFEQSADGKAWKTIAAGTG
ncbi:MAG TPA: hypothetical protein VHU23_01860 [Rhizomicrobium sp.]|jgi:hypothetical protein|nr:hypothetical protein [Rhizomicrobium sp.]